MVLPLQAADGAAAGDDGRTVQSRQGAGGAVHRVAAAAPGAAGDGEPQAGDVLAQGGAVKGHPGIVPRADQGLSAAVHKGHGIHVAQIGDFRYIGVHHVPDVVAAVLQHPGQLLPGIGDRPPVIRNGDLRLVGVFLSPEIGHVGAPDVLRVLGGAAVGGVVVGLGQLAVIIEALPLRLLHRPVRGGGGLTDAAVRLAVCGAAHVESVGGQVLGGEAGKGPGAHGLGLQGLQLPVPRHFRGQNALHIVLQVHHVHHLQPAAADGVLEPAPVAVPPEPGDGVPALGHHGQGGLPALIEDPVCAGDGHLDAVPACRLYGDGGLVRLTQGHEGPVVLEVPELVTAALIVFQVGGGHDGGAVPQPHLHRIIGDGGGADSTQGVKCHNQRQQEQAFFHRTSPSHAP